MAAFDFPASPTVGQVYTAAGISFIWNGYAWDGGPIADNNMFVKKSGDTMTGTLDIAPASDQATLLLDGAAGGSNPFVNSIAGRRAGLNRWVEILGNGGTEAGGNVGSDYQLNRYDDSGAYIDNPLTIERATGLARLSKGTLAGVPQAFANRSGAGAVGLGTATWTKVNIGTVSTSGLSGYFNANNNRLTVLKPGIYVVTGTVLIQTPTQICSILGGFGYNSDTVPSRYWRGQNAVANNWQYSNMAMGIFNCAANDFFSLMGFCGVAGGTVLDTAAETNMTAFLLAAT